jgi:hypothetical protein
LPPILSISVLLPTMAGNPGELADKFSSWTCAAASTAVQASIVW